MIAAALAALAALACHCSATPSWEERLVSDLLDGYNRLVLPVSNSSDVLKVWFGLGFVQLLQVSEQLQVMNARTVIYSTRRISCNVVPR